MADPPSVEDTQKHIDVSVEGLPKLTEDIAKAKSELIGLSKEYAKNPSDALGNALNVARMKFDQLVTSAKSALTALSRFSDFKDKFKAWTGNSEILDGVTKSVSTLGKGIKNLGVVGGALTSKKFANLVDPLNETTVATDLLEKSFNINMGAMKNLIKVQDSVRTAFVMQGKSIDGAEASATKFATTLIRMSAYTGLSKKELNDFAADVGKNVPWAFDDIGKHASKVRKIIGQTISPLSMLQTSFVAFGKTGAQAAAEANRMYEKFGQGPIDAAKSLGVLNAAQKGTDVRAGLVYQQITRASESLAIFGRKSSDAADVWRTFTNALKSSGVPVAAIGDMVANVTDSIAKMSTQHKAFISMVSGAGAGRSAIGGALKMELEMREPGGMQKNLESLTKTLGRFAGGKIVTLKEAVDNPQLENIFMIQRQMLKQMGVGQSDEQRNRMLEVMKGIHTGGISQIQAEGEAKKVFEAGKDLAQSRLDIMTKMERNTSVMVNDISRVNDKLAKLNELVQTSGGLGFKKGGVKFAQEEAAEPNRRERMLDMSMNMGAAIADMGKGISNLIAGKESPHGGRDYPVEEMGPPTKELFNQFQMGYKPPKIDLNDNVKDVLTAAIVAPLQAEQLKMSKTSQLQATPIKKGDKAASYLNINQKPFEDLTQALTSTEGAKGQIISLKDVGENPKLEKAYIDQAKKFDDFVSSLNQSADNTLLSQAMGEKEAKNIDDLVGGIRDKDLSHLDKQKQRVVPKKPTTRKEQAQKISPIRQKPAARKEQAQRPVTSRTQRKETSTQNNVIRQLNLMNETSKTGLNGVGEIINKSNSKIHEDLMSLIATTRDGLDSLQQTVSPPATETAGTTNIKGDEENVITVRVVGSEEKVKQVVVAALKKHEEEKNNSDIGIYS